MLEKRRLLRLATTVISISLVVSYANEKRGENYLAYSTASNNEVNEDEVILNPILKNNLPQGRGSFRWACLDHRQ